MAGLNFGGQVIKPTTNSRNSSKENQQRRPWWEKAAVVIALGLLIVTFFQVMLTRQQVHVGQRAYIVLQHPTLTDLPQAGETLECDIEIINSGETPATDIDACAAIFVADSPNFPCAHRQFGYVGAGRSIGLSPKLLNKLTTEQYNDITQEEFTVDNNKMTLHEGPHLFVTADVKYKDVFGETGETKLCAVFATEFSDPKTLVSCTSGNTMTWENTWW